MIHIFQYEVLHHLTHIPTSDVVVNVSGIDLGENKEKDFSKTVYYPQLLKDDSDVDYMFRLMVENNTLHLYV